jgi:hypothetical protein
VRSARDGLARSTRWGATSLRRIAIPLRRHLGAVVVFVVVVTLVVMVAIGDGYHPRTAQALDGGAWLGSANGAVVHANGSSARVDWVLAASPGDFQVIQAGTGGLIDAATGVARTIDGSDMALSKPTDLGRGDPSLVAGGGRAYVVYRATGIVQPVDPTSLAPDGPALTLGDAVGSTAIDGQGALYAVMKPSGTIDTVAEGSVEAQISGGSPSGRLVAVGGSVMEVDLASDAAVTLAADGAAASHPLGLAADSTLEIPAQTSSAPLWITDASAGTIVGIDPGHGVIQQIPVGASGATLGAPQAAGRLVYLTDSSTGTVLTVDPARRATAHQVVFAPGSNVRLFAKDGLVWGNDFASSRAMVADAQGAIKLIEKYEPGKTHSGPVVHRVRKPVKKVRHKAVRKPRPAKKKSKKKVHKTKRSQVHHPAPPVQTTIPASTTTLPVCPTTTTTTPPSSTSSSSSSTTSTTLPCQPGSTTTTTCPPPSTPTTSTSTTEPDTSTTSSTSTTEPPTTTTNPCQPTTTTTTSTTTSTTTADTSSTTQP